MHAIVSLAMLSGSTGVGDDCGAGVCGGTAEEACDAVEDNVAEGIIVLAVLAWDAMDSDAQDIVVEGRREGGGSKTEPLATACLPAPTCGMLGAGGTGGFVVIGVLPCGVRLVPCRAAGRAEEGGGGGST